MRKLFIAGGIALGATFGALIAYPALANTGSHPLKSAGGSYNGVFGKFDRAQVQRGFQIYKEVCASCHSMNQLHYRNLGEKHGPFYDPHHPNANENPVVKAIAAGYTIKDLDASGNEVERPGVPADKFLAPFETEKQAADANGGKAPPDLSVITKARMGGADYVYSLMLGYDMAAPHDLKIPDGKVYNAYFAGGIFGMPKQLTPDRVTYADTPENKGITASVDQQAKDISAFLEWAADPHATTRKSAGIGTLLFLFIFSILTWFSYKSVWRNVKH